MGGVCLRVVIVVYAHIVFTNDNVSFQEFEDPIPNWPVKEPENLQHLYLPVSDGARDYFANLTTGQFLCSAHTAQNFEIYNINVEKESLTFTKWIDILTEWISHFAQESLERNALWALFNRRNKRFKELQKCFNARRNPKVKESFVTFLNEAITLTKRKNNTTVFDVTSTNDANFKPTTSTDYNAVERVSNCTSTMNYESLLKQNKQLVKVSAKKSSILKSQTSTLLKVKGQNKHLKDQLKENPGLNRLEFSVQQGYLNSTIITEEIAFALMYYYVCSPLMQKVKSVKSPLDMNHFYEATIDKLQKWSDDPTGLMTGNDLLWENATGPQVYQRYMMEIHKKSADNTLLFDTLKVMAKAGKQKLKEHAIEHLTGGQYAEPTPEMEVAANTVGEATNDRIESMFGMLDRQMKLAPSSNPVNVSSLISAKQDKPIQWLKNSNLPVEKVCNIAMTQAAQKQKKEGTRVEQIKRRYLKSKAEREAKIAKRRKMRQERKQRLDENLKEANLKLCRSGNNVKKMLKKDISYQVKLWRAVGAQQEVVSFDSLKNFSKLSSDQQVISLQRVIRLNKELIVQTVYEWDTSDDVVRGLEPLSVHPPTSDPDRFFLVLLYPLLNLSHVNKNITCLHLLN